MKTQEASSITPRDLHQQLTTGNQPDILDVRSPAEYESAHIPGATLVPLDRLDPVAYMRDRKCDGPVYMVCHSGGRAAKAIGMFQRAGFSGCVLLEGGTQAWMDAGLPVNRGESKRISVPRQTQLTMGLICATGATLALAVDVRFALIPLFIGCGLILAGLSGLCPLAELIARMPWNQGSSRSRGSCSTGSCCSTQP